MWEKSGVKRKSCGGERGVLRGRDVGKGPCKEEQNQGHDMSLR